MPALPWAGLQAIDHGLQYAAMASYLPVNRYRSIPGFLRDTMVIRRQLARAPGLVGYTLDADLAHKTFWTFSVWADQASLRAFATSDPHRRITRRLAPRMGTSKFEFFPVQGSDLPLPWRQIKALVRGEQPPPSPS